MKLQHVILFQDRNRRYHVWTTLKFTLPKKLHYGEKWCSLLKRDLRWMAQTVSELLASRRWRTMDSSRTSHCRLWFYALRLFFTYVSGLWVSMSERRTHSVSVKHGTASSTLSCVYVSEVLGVSARYLPIVCCAEHPKLVWATYYTSTALAWTFF